MKYHGLPTEHLPTHPGFQTPFRAGLRHVQAPEERLRQETTEMWLLRTGSVPPSLTVFRGYELNSSGRGLLCEYDTPPRTSKPEPNISSKRKSLLTIAPVPASAAATPSSLSSSEIHPDLCPSVHSLVLFIDTPSITSHRRPFRRYSLPAQFA
jgi:hypothetical protein